MQKGLWAKGVLGCQMLFSSPNVGISVVIFGISQTQHFLISSSIRDSAFLPFFPSTSLFCESICKQEKRKLRSDRIYDSRNRFLLTFRFYFWHVVTISLLCYKSPLTHIFRANWSRHKWTFKTVIQFRRFTPNTLHSRWSIFLNATINWRFMSQWNG